MVIRNILRTDIVPSDDIIVRHRLRSLDLPMTYFGEGPLERRNRLAKALSERSECGPQRTSHRHIITIFIVLFSAVVYYIIHQKQDVTENQTIIINFKQVADIPKKYPNLAFSEQEMRTIKTRLQVMRREISVLMLLGQSRDEHCTRDPTYCIGLDIANSTQSQFEYIDASSANSQEAIVQQKLSKSFTGNVHTVVIDSLEKLPGSQVMNIFQYVDRIEHIDDRRGMLLFIVYTGASGQMRQAQRHHRKNMTAEMAEQILVDSWGPTIPKDKLTSVISRMCRSIIKVY